MDKIFKQLSSTISECSYSPNEFVIPSYSEISKSKEKFYSLYGTLVSEYNTLCNRIHKLSYCLTSIRMAFTLVKEQDFTSRQVDIYNRELRNYRENIEECLQMYKPLKDSYEASLRFFSSTQYLITSYRMEEV